MGYGRSSPVRLLLDHCGLPFDYKGYDFPEWGAVKGAGQGGEFGGLPRVCINGEEFGQSMASLRMLGSKKGLYFPNDWKCAAYCDTILDAWVDLLNKLSAVSFEIAPDGSNMEAVSPKADDVIEKVHVPLIKYMEKQLTDLGTTYIAGDKPTIADVVMCTCLVDMWENPAGPWSSKFTPILSQYPKVTAYN